MSGPDNSEELRAHKKGVAVELLSSCGLDKETVQKRFGLIEDEKEKPFILSFKPSSETQPLAAPFVPFDKKQLDRRDLPPPKVGGEEI